MRGLDGRTQTTTMVPLDPPTTALPAASSAAQSQHTITSRSDNLHHRGKYKVREASRWALFSLHSYSCNSLVSPPTSMWLFLLFIRISVCIVIPVQEGYSFLRPAPYVDYTCLLNIYLILTADFMFIILSTSKVLHMHFHSAAGNFVIWTGFFILAIQS
jgi:hypothetical protein